MTFQFSLFERLKAWAELFAKREIMFYDRRYDEAYPDAISLGSSRELPSEFPEDAREFAKSSDAFFMDYEFSPFVQKDYPDLKVKGGTLALTLEEFKIPIHLKLDGEVVDSSTIYNLDADHHGIGKSGWYLMGDAPSIVWSIEEQARFDSLTDYLTLGAKRAFARGPRFAWQQPEFDESQMASLCIPKTTPLAEIRERLIDQGAEDAMADDLIEWLGADVTLLLEKD